MIGKAPIYLIQLLKPYEPTRTLRSADQRLLKEKCGRLKRMGDRSFEVAGPKLWNKLPEDLRKCDDIEPFKDVVYLWSVYLGVGD